MTMTINEFEQYAQGKTGSIYIVKKGKETVISIEGTNYLLNNVTGGNVIVNPLNAWDKNITWAGGYTDYFLYKMIPEDNPIIKANPLVQIRPDQLEALKKIAAMDNNSITAMARKGGQAKSPAKTAAARENAKKPRPRNKNKEE